MRIDELRTFLEVASAGSFSAAAKRLHVTQSTVSMRVKTLEDALDRPLFLRDRGGARLSAAGLQFHHYAVSLVQMWQQAHQEVALPAGYRTSFGLGTQVSLWQRLIPTWIPWMRDRAPDVALRVEANYSDTLMSMLIDGLLDVGVMYGPRTVPGFVIEPLLEEKLVMVSTFGEKLSRTWHKSYVYCDWGDLFRAWHSEAFVEMNAPPVSVSLGALGLGYILENGGIGYFPTRLVRPLVSSGKLYQVTTAPVFTRPAYMVYREREEPDEVVARAVEGLRRSAAQTDIGGD